MSYSGSFGSGPSPRGRSASRHDDDIFGSPRSRSSRSKSRPRLSEAKLGYDPSDPIFRNSSPSRRSSRSRRPSISVAYTGASFATHGTHDDDYLEPRSFSPEPRAPRSPSRYPPSASKSGSLSYSPTGIPVDVGYRNRSRSRRRSSISLGDAPTTGIFPLELSTDELLGYGPDSSSRRPRAASLERQTRDSFKPRSGTTSWSGSGDYASESFAGDAFEPSRISRGPTAPALEPPFRSKFFGSGSSSSGSRPSAPRPLEGDPSITSRRRSRSSGRSKDSSLFGRASGEEDFAFPPPTTSFGRTNTRGAPQIRRTSFVSGFSDQMEYDEHGQEHFRRGTVLYDRYNAYKTDNRNATDAIIRYKEKKAELPPRKRVISGPDAAIGDSRGLGGNFTIREHKELRNLAHQTFKHRRAETIGRESFNRDYGTVWEKRTRQTERSSDENHEQVARAMRQNANEWLDTRERHAEAQLDLGYPETLLTPYSSWGSHSGSHRSG